MSATYTVGQGAGHSEDICCRLGDPVTGALPEVSCGGPGDSGADRGSEAGVDGAPKDSGVNATGTRDAGTNDAGTNDAGTKDAGLPPPAPRPPRALLCQLWTDGDADITVHAKGYPDIQERLKATVVDSRCGVETEDVRVLLSRDDGGS